MVCWMSDHARENTFEKCLWNSKSMCWVATLDRFDKSEELLLFEHI